MGQIFETACKANQTHTWWYNMHRLIGAGKLHIHLDFRPVAYKQHEATVPYF